MNKYSFKELMLKRDIQGLLEACNALAKARVERKYGFPGDLFNWDSQGLDKSDIYEYLGTEYLQALLCGRRTIKLNDEPKDVDGLITHDFDYFIFDKIRQCSPLVGNQHKKMRRILHTLQDEGLIVKRGGFCHFIGSTLPATTDDLLQALESIPKWELVLYDDESQKTSPWIREPDMRKLILALLDKAPGNVPDGQLFLALLHILNIRPYCRVESEIIGSDDKPQNIIDQHVEGDDIHEAMERLESEVYLRRKLEDLEPLEGEIVCLLLDGQDKDRICVELDLTREQLNRRIRGIKKKLEQ